MTRLLLILSLLIGQISFGQTTDTTFGRPILWYRVSDPWAMFMGAEGPVFILYESGKILFWKNRAYRLTQTTDQERDELINDLNLNDTFFIKSRFFNSVSPDFDNSKGEVFCCDQPTYTINYLKDTISRITVLGSVNSRPNRKSIPDKFLSVHDYITNFDTDKSSTWIPDKIEVLLSDYSHSPDTPIEWPTEWPDLNSSATRMQNGYATSIFLDKKYFKQLTKLLKQRKEKQAFEINDKKYFVGYRFPIPGLW